MTHNLDIIVLSDSTARESSSNSTTSLALWITLLSESTTLNLLPAHRYNQESTVYQRIIKHPQLCPADVEEGFIVLSPLVIVTVHFQVLVVFHIQLLSLCHTELHMVLCTPYDKVSHHSPVLSFLTAVDTSNCSWIIRELLNIAVLFMVVVHGVQKVFN